MELSKSEFAAHIKVSPGRVSQYLREGLIGKDALVGEGRSARIVVEKAVEQLRTRRHVGQAMGNGLLTDLGDGKGDAGGAGESDAGAELQLTGSKDDVAKQIQLERLEQERRKNRRETIEEAQQLGQLVRVEDFRHEVGKTAQTLVTTFMGMAPDIANAIAAEFKVPQRDVLVLVRRVMNAKRAHATTALRLAAEEMPDTVDAELEVEQ